MANRQAGNTGSRRDFLKRSMLTAAGALGASKVVTAATVPPAPAIRVPDAIPAALNLPVKPASFPMRGAQVFAKVCKNEGLQALFCCPGNYDVINSICDEGIPCFGGRTEGAMCAAADGFIRVTGEIAADRKSVV